MKTKWFVPLLSLLLLFTALHPLSMAAEPLPPRLEVMGRGAVAAEPDTAVITFAVETNRPRASDAMAENAANADKLLKALKALMGEKDKIQTAGYNVYPVYDRGDRLRPAGYRVSNSVVLETRAIDRVGRLIDAAAGAGVGSVRGLQFKSSRESEIGKEAAVIAVKEARETAEMLARAAGVSIKGVREIRYTPRHAAPVFKAEAAMARASTPVEPGEISIEAEVTVVFDIE